MQKQLHTLSEVCNILGVKLAPPPNLVEVIGEQPQVVAYFPQLGARRGMIVVRTFKEIAPYAKLLVNAGFAFTTIDWANSNVIVDTEDMVRIFSDWGWASLDEPRPDWIELYVQEQ